MAEIGRFTVEQQVANLTPKIEAALDASALTLVRHWKQTLSEPGTGKLYEAGLRFITKGGKVIPIRDEEGRLAPHKASAPGSAPAVDTGTLRNSIDTDAPAPLERRVGSGNKVATWLHFGVFDHPGNIVIEPRPHGTIALNAARDDMTKAFAAQLRG